MIRFHVIPSGVFALAIACSSSSRITIPSGSRAGFLEVHSNGGAVELKERRADLPSLILVGKV
jgi:hypothetical protein